MQAPSCEVMMSHARPWTVVVLALCLCAACNPARGCKESDFTLARESRLPKWFNSTGLMPGEASVTMGYYNRPGRRSAIFVLRDSSGRKVSEVSGELRGSRPTMLSQADSSTRYPRYEVITVGDVVEVIEHRRLEPVFYINDDAELHRRLGVP